MNPSANETIEVRCFLMKDFKAFLSLARPLPTLLSFGLLYLNCLILLTKLTDSEVAIIQISDNAHMQIWFVV